MRTVVNEHRWMWSKNMNARQTSWLHRRPIAGNAVVGRCVFVKWWQTASTLLMDRRTDVPDGALIGPSTPTRAAAAAKAALDDMREWLTDDESLFVCRQLQRQLWRQAITEWRPDTWKPIEQKSPAVAREDALQTVQFLLQYWVSKSSKVDVSSHLKKRMRFPTSDQ